MKFTHLASAASALGLMIVASQAGAQTMAPSPAAPADQTTAPASDPAAATSAMAPAAGATMAAPAATDTAANASAVVATTTVTNGPVADTPENRAKYGQPMSRAGKRTAAKGN